jgi:hypothetical protein
MANAIIFDPSRLFLTTPNGLLLPYSVITDQSCSFQHHNQHHDHEFGVGTIQAPLKLRRSKIVYGDNCSKIYKFYVRNFRVSNACCGVMNRCIVTCGMWVQMLKHVQKPCVRISDVRYVCLN